MEAGGRLLGALDQYAPVFGDGHLAVEGGGGFAGFNLNGDIEFTLGVAAEDAMRRRDVCVVAADGGADVAVVGDEVVGGVEADPA